MNAHARLQHMHRFGRLHVVDRKRRVAHFVALANGAKRCGIASLVAVRDVGSSRIGELLDVFAGIGLEMLFPHIGKNAHCHHDGHDGNERKGYGYTSGIREAKEPIMNALARGSLVVSLFLATCLLRF